MSVMFRLLLSALLILLAMAGFSQVPPPQKINSNYQFRAVGGDSALRPPKQLATQIGWLDSGSLYYHIQDSSLYLWTGTEGIPVIRAGGTGAGNVYRYNVLNYGVVRDSTIVQTSAIQRTLDSCHRAGGGVVYMPNGVFLSGKLHGYVDTYILGEGAGTTIKAAAGTDTMLVYDSEDFNASRGIQMGYSPVENVVFDGQGVAKCGISMRLVYWFNWRNISIFRTNVAIFAKGTLTGKFTNITTRNDSIGIYLDSLTNAVIAGVVAPNLIEIDNCRLYSASTWGVFVRGTQGLISMYNDDFEFCGIIHNPNTGCVYNTGPTAGAPSLVMRNCWTEQNSGTVYKQDRSTASTQTDLIDCNFQNNNSESIGVWVQAPHPGNVVNMIGTTMTGDSVEFDIDGNTFVNAMGCATNLASNNIGANGVYFLRNVGGQGNVGPNLSATSPAPTLTLGVGAGTGATASLSPSSTAMGGTITLVTGTLPTASSNVITITLPSALGITAGTDMQWSPANAAASGLTVANGLSAIGSSTSPYKPTFNVGAVGLTAATTYILSYLISVK